MLLFTMLGNANTAENVISINATDPNLSLELEFSIEFSPFPLFSLKHLRICFMILFYHPGLINSIKDVDLFYIFVEMSFSLFFPFH